MEAEFREVGIGGGDSSGALAVLLGKDDALGDKIRKNH